MTDSTTYPCPCGCGMVYGSESTASLNGHLHAMLKGPFSDLLPAQRQVRWRYFQRGKSPCFCWTTEPIDGKYESYVLKPVGKGARTKPVDFEIDDSETSRHTLRKDAKARALKKFNAWKDTHA